MGRKYLASLLAVAMFAAGVPCAQAEELDTNTANITDSQTIQGEAQDTGSSDEGTVSSNGTDDALNASADSQIAGRTVENIDKGWMFSKGDASMDGWTFPHRCLRGDHRSAAFMGLRTPYDVVHSPEQSENRHVQQAA